MNPDSDGASESHRRRTDGRGIRDGTFAEDLPQIRTAHVPATMAALRNLAVSLPTRSADTPIRVQPLLT